jgi:hypothetical protein
VNLLFPAGRDRDGRSEPPAKRTEPGAELFDSLRDAALRVATPWITRFVDEHLSPPADVSGAGETPAAPDGGGRPAAGTSDAAPSP